MIRNILKLQSAFTLSSRCYVRNLRRTENPGISKQVKKFQNEIPLDDDVEDFSEYDTDFMNVNQSHRLYEQETQKHREQIQHLMVANKYFKNIKLNFLTWAEKEQIRHLHQCDAIEWNAGKLAESFPADIQTITKILKSKWTPQSDERIRKHDSSVKKVWKQFVNNEIENLHPSLVEHLHKFSHRNVEHTKIMNVIEKPSFKIKSMGNEFASIISSCKKYKPPELEASTETKENSLKISNRSFFLGGKISKSKPMIFSELQNENSVPQDYSSKIIENPSGTGVVAIKPSQHKDIFKINKYDNNEIQVGKNDLRKLSVPAIREYIKIPKRLFQQGATYKMDDCYYDDDGEFLYRVPGMTNNKC